MASRDLQPIERSPLYEQVAARLRDFIDAQNLRPGDRLASERELAERLEVSRTSVRQALTALKVMGLVEIRHGDGVYVLRSPADLVSSLAAEIDESEVDHPMIWEVREAIEVQAARLAAKRRRDDDLAAMRGALDDMAESIATGGDGIDGDRRFHRAIAMAAGNPLLLRLFDELADVIDRTSAASLTLSGRPPVSLEAHHAILAAIAAADEDTAAEAMHQHIMTSGERVLASTDAGSDHSGDAH